MQHILETAVEVVNNSYFSEFMPHGFTFLKGKQDVKTQSWIHDTLRWVCFAAWHQDVGPLGMCCSAQGVEKGAGEGAFDFPSSASKCLQTSLFTAPTGAPTYTSSPSCAHADWWLQLLHTSLWLTYIFNHPHRLYMTRDMQIEAHWHRQTGLFRSLFHVCRAAPGKPLEIWGSFNWCREPDWRLWSSCWSQPPKMWTVGYLEAGGCFGPTQTHTQTFLASTVWVSLSSQRLLISILNVPSFCFRDFFIWSSTIHRNYNKAPLLIFWGSDPVLICSTGDVASLQNTTLKS